MYYLAVSSLHTHTHTHSKLRRRRTTILRAQLCMSLLLLLLAYAAHVILDYTATLPQDIPIPCVVISVFTHYFTLTSLVWVGTEALLMFRKLVFGQRLGDLSNLFFVAVSVTSWRTLSCIYTHHDNYNSVSTLVCSIGLWFQSQCSVGLWFQSQCVKYKHSIQRAFLFFSIAVVPFPFSAIPAVLNQDWMVTEDE